jgi:hypothetical protein
MRSSQTLRHRSTDLIRLASKLGTFVHGLECRHLYDKRLKKGPSPHPASHPPLGMQKGVNVQPIRRRQGFLNMQSTTLEPPSMGKTLAVLMYPTAKDSSINSDSQEMLDYFIT